MCDDLLSAAFEIDHIVALENGGADDAETNGQALCPNCHALKSQTERIERIKMAREKLKTQNLSVVPVKNTPKRSEDVILDDENPFACFAYLKPTVQISKRKKAPPMQVGST